MKTLAFVCVLFAAAAGTVAMDVSQSEEAVTDAKAAYVADPNDRNLADLEAAVAAFQSSSPAAPKDVKAMATETEPNDTAGTANPVADGDYIEAGISPAGDVDYFANGGNGIQDLVFAAVVTAGSSTGTDSQMNVYAGDGVTLIEYDDDSGPGLASCVAGGVVPQAGDVYFAVNEYGNDGEITPYRLFQVVAPVSASVAESEPNDDAGSATPVTATFVSGSITSTVAPDVDFFSFAATVGDVMEVIVDDDPDGNSTALDSELDLLDTDGATVLAAGDDNSGNPNNCAGSVVAPATGTYYVRISDGATSVETDYRFSVVINGGGVPVELMSFDTE